MEKYVEQYWNIRLEQVKEALEENNFEVYLTASAAEAKQLVLEKILPKTGAKSVSWGGSMTLKATGLPEALLQMKELKALNPDDKNLSREDKLELRRHALLTDLYLAGANAVIESGILVNLDMFGNRVGAITFGPKHVVILAGRNKIVPDLDAAMHRIKDYASPANVMRLDMKTPCLTTATCEECKSPMRICNTWTITEKSFPQGRIKVVLINEDLGL